MSKVKARQNKQPLSFIYKRPAETSELNLLLDKIEGQLPHNKAGLKALLQAVGMAIFTFIFVAPLTFFFGYVVESLTVLKILSFENLLTFSFFWMSVFLLQVCINQIVTRKYALNVLQGMKADLKNRTVQEETWRFIEAKTLQTPENDEVFYLLLADSGDILALSETQLLGRKRARGEIAYNLAPADLTVLRAPLSQLLIKSFSSGPLLEINASYTFFGKKEQLPLEGENLRLTKGLSWSDVENYATGG